MQLIIFVLVLSLRLRLALVRVFTAQTEYSASTVYPPWLRGVSCALLLAAPPRRLLGAALLAALGLGQGALDVRLEVRAEEVLAGRGGGAGVALVGGEAGEEGLGERGLYVQRLAVLGHGAGHAVDRVAGDQHGAGLTITLYHSVSLCVTVR